MNNLVFFGTDEFAAAVLEELAGQKIIPALVVTVPDQKQGRGLNLVPPPVKIWAEKNGVRLDQPENLKDYHLPPCDVAIVAAYGKIIPADLLTQPEYGILNIHPSLLPKYRGPSPIQTAILNGDEETGVTIMRLDEKLDHGAILGGQKTKIKKQKFVELRDELAKLGAGLIAKILPDYLTGKIKPREQDHAAATYTKKITKEDGLVSLDADPIISDRKFRALTPWPGLYFVTKVGKRIKITDAVLANGVFQIKKVIPAGKPEMTWDAFRRGHQI